MAVLKPVSFNGTSILSGTSTDYKTEVPRNFAPLQAPTSAMFVKRAGAYPVFSGKDFLPFSYVLEVEAIANFQETFESLNKLFDVKDETPRQLIVQDTDDSNKQYYIYASPTNVQGGHDGPMATVTLAVDDPIWQTVTQNSQTWSTTTTTGTTDVVNAGNDEAYPIFEITTATQPSTDFIYSVYLQILPQSSYYWFNRFLDITGATDTTFDTAALVTAGKMQSDGDDLRVFRDGVEIERWLNGINTTDTHVIVAASLPPANTALLKTAIASSDTITEIEVTYTDTAKNNLLRMPNSGRLILDSSLGSTDTEEFTYSAKTITDTKLAFTINARSVRGTTAFSYSAGANVRHLPYDFTIIYGSATASAPTVNNNNQPAPALTSRNNSFTYSTVFNNDARTRPSGISGLNAITTNPLLTRSVIYTSTNDEGDTDPFTAMGMKAQTYEAGGIWRADTVQLAWVGYFLDGVASVSASGTQTQNSASWPTLGLYAAGQNVKNPLTNSGWTQLWTVSAQATTDYATWTAWSKASSDATIPSGATQLKWHMQGTVLGSTDYYAKGDITSLTVGLTNYPHVMIRTETQNNKLDFTITNATTAESMRIIYPLQVGQTLIVDTDPDNPSAKINGTLVNGAVTLSSIRSKWLKLSPGTNTLNYDTNIAAASDISIVIKWRDRLNFF